MHKNINFPNLGIHLGNVGKSISVFGFEIAFYGMIIGAAILIGLLLALKEAKRTGQKKETYYDLAIYGVIFSVLSARLYYVIFSWDMYKGNLLSIFNFRQGGLAIYGGIIGAVATGIIYAKKKHLSAALIFDTVAMSLVNGQMMGRWGNFFNREAFGEYTNGLFAMQLPVDAVRASDITDKMQKHIVKLDGVSYIQVSPTFLYESFWCLLVLLVLFFWRKRKRYDGELFLIYLFGYGLGRVWIEGLRTDQLLLPGIGWPVSQVLAGVIVLVTGALMVYKRKKHKMLENRK